MSDVDLKNALLSGDPDAGDETEEVKTHAGVVIIRPLSRAEVLGLQEARRRAKLTLAQFEARMVAAGMVSPVMTPTDVEQWQSVEKAGGALKDVTEKIAEISGLAEGASKSGVSGAGQ